MSCSKNNFDNNLHSESINFVLELESQDIDILAEDIISTLRQRSFSVDIDISENPDGYEDGINSLIESILNKLDEKNKLPFEFSSDRKEILSRKIREAFTPREKTKLERNIEAVIRSEKMFSQEEVEALKFNEVLVDIFGNNITIRTFGEDLFRDKLRILTIIDQDTGEIVDGIDSLNKKLAEFKESEYLKLEQFILSKNFDRSLIASNYYYGESASENVENIYTMMYNYIKDLQNKGKLEDAIKNSWENKLNGQDSKFFDALDAYINLQFFDERLKQAFGKYIVIDKNYDEPINTVKEKKYYKYSLSTGNSEMVKGWEVGEYQDAIDLMSGYTSILINSIPLITINDDFTKIGKFLRLTPVYFTNALINLRSAIANMPDNLALQDLLWSTLDTPEKWIEIFDKIFNSKEDSKLLQTTLLNVKSINGTLYFNKFDLNIIYSIYKQVFDRSNPKSYISIEQSYFSTNGVNGNRYPIISTLLGYINATAGMDYLEVVYDTKKDVPGYTLQVKRKFNSNISTFDIVKSINRSTYLRTEKLVSRYNFFTENEEKLASISFSEVLSGPIKVIFKNHILDKTSSASFEEALEGIYDKDGNLDKNLDLSTQEARRKLLTNPNRELKIFMEMLKFIDNMLGTTFSMDEDGLTELKELTLQGGKFIKLFLTALRALKITEIYSKLEDNPNYQKIEIIKFLSENPEVYARNFWKSRDSLKTYILENKQGKYLSVVTNGEGWIRRLSVARMILNGSSSKAVTKNLEGNYLPNNSPTYLGAQTQSYLKEAVDKMGASSHLLFSQANRRVAIKGIVIDTDIKLKDGTIKLVKNMSESELLTRAIVDKFHLSLTNKNRGTVIIQSTTLSDKTKYVNHEVSLSDLGINIYSPNVASLCTMLLYNTVGEFYKSMRDSVLNDYEKLFGTRDIAKIELRLNEFSDEISFINFAWEKGVTVYKDVHYRPGKKLSFNEILYNYSEDLFASILNLEKRLEIERKQFVNDLTRTLTNFYVTRNNDGSINLQDAIGNFISKLGDVKKYEKEWINGNKLILAQIIDTTTGKVRNIEYENLTLNPNEHIILNPFLEAYFSVDVLVSNNLRYALTGSEVNHKIKGKFSVVNTLKKNKVANLYKFNENTTIVEAMERLKRIANDLSRSEKSRMLATNAYNVIRDDLIYSREAAGQGALLKRNVIISATMRPYLQNQPDGVPPKMRVAVIDDVQAVVLNFDGSGCLDKDGYKSKTIDAHDGFATINPIFSILENNSLQDNEVGTMKKNILHGYNHQLGVSSLIKYAAGAITNSWMRDSEMSPILLRNLFKKMSNERWSLRFSDGTIKWLLTDNGKESGVVDLLKCDYKDDEFCTFDLKLDILSGRRLFYQDKKSTYEITEFGKDGEDYYTIEHEVSFNGEPIKGAKNIKIYHYFDNLGKHTTSITPISNKYKFNEDGSEKYHTIDSIYELWTSLGGLESMELVNGLLEESEASLFATANFVNYVANKKEGTPENAEITLVYYDQPLKRGMIAYIVNNSAIKNGAGNQNPTSSYYDDTPLKTIILDTKGHGIQLDADHEADEATMTEFSQVITSLDSGGRMHNYVKLIYGVLGKVALELSNIEIESVEAFRLTKNKSKIYDLIGRTIMKNMKDGQKGLLSAIMKEIKKEFNVNSDHDKDIFKIPFDDPNIYGQILSTFVSIINRKSIKRRYPGSGMVMMPGYDIETVFDYNGQVYLYSDLLKIARKTISSDELNKIVANDNSDFNKQLVLKLLQIELDKQVISDRFDWVNPSDRVNILLNNTLIKDIKLESISDYYRFKGEDLRKLIAEKLFGVKIGKEYDKPWRPKEDNSHLNLDGTVKTNKAFLITLKDVDGYFEIVKDNEPNYWSIHFKTGLKDNNGNFIRDEFGHVVPNPNFTEELKNLMFLAAALVIPEGDFLSTHGDLTPGGISGLNRFTHLGFTLVGERSVVDVTSGNIINIPIFLSKNNISFQKNVTKARNLAPVKITWEMPDGTIMNIFDSWPIKQLYLTGIRDKKAIQKVFDDLNKGRYWDGKTVDIEGNPVYALLDKNKITNTEAECIVPNIFQSKFGVKSNQSLVDILNDSNIFSRNPHKVISDNYDIVFTKNNNKNTYITFKPVNSNSDTFNSNIVDWDDIIVEDYDDPSTGIIHRVFAVNKDNVKLFEVARERIVSTAIWNLDLGKITDRDGNVLDLNKYKKYYDGTSLKILEVVTFVLKRSVKEKVEKQTNKYTLYNINKSALREVYVEKGNKSIDDFIGMLMSDIYNSDDHNGVLLNSTMSTNSAKILRLSLNQFALNQSFNKSLKELILGDGKLNNGLKGLLAGSQYLSNETYKIKSSIHAKLIRNYFKNQSAEIKSSFLKSLYFTSSRIPALTHQSFMQMKAVGFTRGNVTHTFVSHFLTWLLGSDYKSIITTYSYIK